MFKFLGGRKLREAREADARLIADLDAKIAEESAKTPKILEDARLLRDVKDRNHLVDWLTLGVMAKQESQ